MELTPQEMRIRFLNIIMKEHRVSLKSVSDCTMENKDAIDKMDDIFDSDDETAVRKRKALLHIISRDRARKNLDYYCETEKIGKDSVAADVDEYKVLIITALMFNTLFYVSACNWCGLIQREVNRIPKNLEKGTIIRFPEPKHDALAARLPEFSTFHEIPLVYDDTHGMLYFKGNDQQEVILEFEFKDELPQTAPFGLEVCFTTKHDRKGHTIPIPAGSHIEGINSIKSETRNDVYYSDGIEGEYTVKIIPNSP